MESSSSSGTGVPPGFRFHPTDEELLLYYLKKKVSLEKFELEVIREVDLNKIEPWELQERCRIGATPQSEWYFFSHKDRKYPTGSRTNRATDAGFWKATGRDKGIRTSYKKIDMRKTLVFYRGRAPHGQKTDWIMHEYRLEESDDDQGVGSEDGWVACRVFKKKCFFKAGGSETAHIATTTSHYQSHSGGGLYIHHQQPCYNNNHHLHPQATANSFLHYPHHHQVQVHDLLPNPPPPLAGFDFSVLAGNASGMVNVDSCGQIHHNVGGADNDHQGREVAGSSEWVVLDGIGSSVAMQQQQQRGGEMDLWGVWQGVILNLSCCLVTYWDVDQIDD